MLRTLLILAAFLLAPLWGTDSFTSATAGTTVYLPTNPLGFVQTGTYQVSGTFVATLQWQFSVDGRNWATYQTYTAPAGPVVFAAPGYYRFNCSAFTSGTAVGTVTLAPKIYQQQYASNGSLLFQVDDSGVTAAGLGSAAVASVNGLTGAVVFAAGSNITLTPSGQTITIASSGGGGSTPTGTGFTHVTSGTQDGAARAVNVSGADITGTQTVPNGGLGVATLIAYAPIFGGTTTTGAVQSGTVGSAGQVLTSNGAGNIPTFQANPAGFANPMTTLGDVIYGAPTGTATRLAGNTTTQRQFFSQTGNGTTSAAPQWVGPLSVGDLPSVLPGSIIGSGVVGNLYGGTGQDTSAAANGSLLIGTGTGLALANLSAGTNTTVTNGSGTLAVNAPLFVASGGSHAAGTVPDPGASAGTTKFLREDATWQVPAAASGVTSLNSLTGGVTLAAGTNVTFGTVGNTITINSSGGGGGGFPVNTTTYAVQDSTDATKQQLYNLASATTGTNLTLKDQQTTSQTLAFPNIAGADTLAALGTSQTFTATNTFNTAVTPMSINAGVANAVAPPIAFSFLGGSDTALTNGSAGSPEVVFDMSPVKQWGGNTGVSNYIGMLVKHPVVGSTTATTTFTTPITFEIDGPPTSSTNASVSGGLAMEILSGNAQFNGTIIGKVATSNMSITQAAASSGAAQSLSFTGGAHTNQTAGANLTQAVFNFGQTEQHATGAVALNQTILMTGPTLSAVGASTTTVADTLAIAAPIAGSNMTLTAANALHLTSGQLQADGNISLAVAGSKLLVKEGSNASMGVATLVGGTVTVSNTLVTANSRIYLTIQSLGTVVLPTVVGITARSAGTSFTITSASATDTSVIAWHIVEPAP